MAVGFISDVFANLLLSMEYGATVWTPPSGWYFGLFTADPTGASGSGTEAAIARVLQTNNVTNYPAASSRISKNATSLNFGTPGADLGTIVGIASFIVSSAGDYYRYGKFTSPFPGTAGVPLVIPANAGTFGYPIS